MLGACRTCRPTTATTAWSTAGPAGAGCCCRRSRSASGGTSATTGRSRRAARSSAARSTSASRTSTSRTTTGRRTARRRRTSARSCAATSGRTATSSSISTKAGYDMWPGPVRRVGVAQVPAREPRPEPRAAWGSTTSTSSTRTASTRRRRSRRRWARSTPPCAQGKALYAGISSYSAEKTREAAAILRDLGTPLLIHQPSYSMLNRWIEPDLLDALGELGVGCIVFSPLAQGMLTDKYLDGIPGGLARELAELALARAPHRRGAREDPRAERDRRRARPDARADGARLGAARRARDVGADRRVERRAARGQRRRARPARLHRRRARRDRPLRDGQRRSTSGPRRAKADRSLQACCGATCRSGRSRVSAGAFSRLDRARNGTASAEIPAPSRYDGA